MLVGEGLLLVDEEPLLVDEGPLLVDEGPLVVPLAVLLYTLRRLGPPQNSELFPLQTIEQPLAGAGAPPLTTASPQSIRTKVNGQMPNLKPMDRTYNTD
jgi:hypothetical protein